MFAFLTSIDANCWLVKPSSVPGISNSAIVLSNISSCRSLLMKSRSRSVVGVSSCCPVLLVASCGPLVGRGGGFRLLCVLGPGVGAEVSDLVRLLAAGGRSSMLVVRNCSGCPKLTYGW